MSKVESNKRLIWFTVIIAIIIGANGVYAAVPQSTVRTDGGITTYVGQYMNATVEYYRGNENYTAWLLAKSGVAAIPFDQDLNTTDNVSFASVNATNDFYLNGANYTAWIEAAIAAGAGVDVRHDQDLNTTDTVGFANINATWEYYRGGANYTAWLLGKADAATTTYDQGLDTTDNVSFASVNATNDFYLNGANYTAWIEAAIAAEILPGNFTLAYEDMGAPAGPRTSLNFIEGENITLTVTDDALNDQINITITSTGGGGVGSGENNFNISSGATAFVGTDSERTGQTNYFLVDGTADEVQINAAVTYANGLGGGEVMFEYGTYVIDASIILKSNVTLNMGQSIIEHSLGTTDYIIEAIGTLQAGTVLSVSASAGDVIVTTAGDPGIEVGDWVRISSSATTFGQVGPDGEIHHVQAVSGAGPYIVNLTSPLYTAYTTGNSAEIKKINVVENVHLIGGVFQGDGDVNDYGVLFNYTVTSSVEGTMYKDAGYMAFAAYSCVDIIYERINVFLVHNIDNGYGVSVSNAADDIKILDSTFEEVRHAFTAGSGGVGFVKRVQILGSTFKNGYNTGQIDTHDGSGLELEVGYCTFYGANYLSWQAISYSGRNLYFHDSVIYAKGSSGWGVTSPGASVRNIHINNVIMYNGRALLYCYSNAVEQIRVINSAAYDVYREFIDIAGNANTEIEIIGCTSLNSGDGSGNGGIEITAGAKSVSIKNNRISESSDAGIQIDNVDSGMIVGNEIWNNNEGDSTTAGQTEGIYLLDCTNFLVSDNKIWADNSKQEYGIREGAGSDSNRIIDNVLSGNTEAQVLILGSNTVLNSERFIFISGDVPPAASPAGFNIVEADKAAFAIGQIPLSVQQVVRIKIWSVALGGPINAGGQMHLEVTFNAGATNLAYNTAAKSWNIANFDGEEATYENGDIVHWVIVDADVGTELLALVAGDSFELNALYETGADPDGATNAAFRIVEIDYV